jgi:hypothetical protein
MVSDFMFIMQAGKDSSVNKYNHSNIYVMGP